MITNLQLSKDLFVPKFYPYLFDYTHRWECFQGSAGSSKSFFITQKLIIRALNEKIRILVCRRYGTTIRNSCFSLFKDILAKWKIINYVKINESDMRITFTNGSEIIFLGLDNEQKLLSLNNISTIFIEEATEITRDLAEQLNLRMRGECKNQQIIMAWNPISKNHWLYDFCEINPPESFIYHHSTFKDNPFLPEENRKAIEELETRNPQKWRVFGLGEWGVDAEGLVFTNWIEQSFNINEIASKYEHRVGCDLGYMDPTAIVSSFWDKENHIIYVANEFYKSGQQLDNVYEAIVNMKLTKSKIWFDSAEPRTIDYFKDKQINAVPCIKGQNSVATRIAFLQNEKIIVHPQCKNVINELSNFSYIRNKQTGEYQEDKYTHEFSHALDSIMYSFSDIYKSKQLKSIDKSLLRL